MKLVYCFIGSGVGIEEFIVGIIDIGIIDVFLNVVEFVWLKEDISEIIVILGMISIVYYFDDIDDIIKLLREVYLDIFFGKIIWWDDLWIVVVNLGLKFLFKFI